MSYTTTLESSRESRDSRESPRPPSTTLGPNTSMITSPLSSTANSSTNEATHPPNGPPAPFRMWRYVPAEVRQIIYTYATTDLFYVVPTGQVHANPPLQRPDFVIERPWPWWKSASRIRLLSPLAERLERLAETFYMLGGADGEAQLERVLRRMVQDMMHEPDWVVGVMAGGWVQELQWWRNTAEHVDLICDFLQWFRRLRTRWVLA